MGVQIITDSACDLPVTLTRERGIEVLPMPYSMKGEDRFDDLGVSTDLDSFYADMRAGARVVTSQVTLGTAYAAYERAYALGHEVVVISLSSELSGTYTSALLAAEQFREAHPDASVHVVDSRCACTGEGLLVLAAAERARAGAPAADVAAWAQSARGRVNHVFTVNTFDHLVRGGRVSAAVGAAGTLLNIKPVMRVDDRGRLVPFSKPRGRRKALETIANTTAERIEDLASQTIAISHGQWPELAEEMKRLLLDRVDVAGVIDARIGCVIGGHTGPETLSVFFWGKEREPFAG